jgi:DNA-binding protein HU-beta
MANKKDMINAIAEATGKTKKDSKMVIDTIMKAIKAGLISGEDVKLVNFGTFKVVARKARKGRNPRTGEALDIPAKNVVRFKVSKALGSTVN